MKYDQHLFARVESLYQPKNLWGSLKMCVAGLPRSGTFFVSRALTKMNISASHETVCGVSGVGKETPVRHVDVTGFAALWVDSMARQGVKVVHLIRHPVPTCNSIVNHLSKLLPDDPKEAFQVAATYYEKWHGMIDKVATATVYLESIEEGLKTITRLLGLDVPPETLARAMGESNKNELKAKPVSFSTWEYLPPSVAEYASTKHGYRP